MQNLLESLAQAAAGDLESFESIHGCHQRLRSLWAIEVAPKVPLTLEELRARRTPEGESNAVAHSSALFDLDGLRGATVLPGWVISFTPKFQKSVLGIDRKLQGRVLLAISEISEDPLTPHGDTLKPMTGDLKGLWRYRLGDFRLVYQPKESSQTVVLLAFASRGDVYE